MVLFGMHMDAHTDANARKRGSNPATRYAKARDAASKRTQIPGDCI